MFAFIAFSLPPFMIAKVKSSDYGKNRFIQWAIFLFIFPQLLVLLFFIIFRFLCFSLHPFYSMLNCSRETHRCRFFSSLVIRSLSPIKSNFSILLCASRSHSRHPFEFFFSFSGWKETENACKVLVKAENNFASRRAAFLAFYYHREDACLSAPFALISERQTHFQYFHLAFSPAFRVCMKSYTSAEEFASRYVIEMTERFALLLLES